MRKSLSITAIFDEIVWLPKRGVGTFFTFELGAPYLAMREAITGDTDVPARLRRRHVSLVGEYHFWAQADEWFLHRDDKAPLRSVDVTEMDEAMEIIAGQRLLSISDAGRRSKILFEYGESLVMNHADVEDQVLWSLYKRGVGVLSSQADGRTSFEEF